MKAILTAIGTCFLVSAAMGSTLTKENIIGNNSDFLILSDVETSDFRVFLSGAGRTYNRCGIALRTHSFGVSASQIQSIIQIDGSGLLAIEEIVEDQLIARINNPEANLFGAFFEIKTKSGLAIASELQKLDQDQKVEVIVQSIPCN